jgi:hypothetical protein
MDKWEVLGVTQKRSSENVSYGRLQVPVHFLGISVSKNHRFAKYKGIATLSETLQFRAICSITTSYDLREQQLQPVHAQACL